MKTYVFDASAFFAQPLPAILQARASGQVPCIQRGLLLFMNACKDAGHLVRLAAAFAVGEKETAIRSKRECIVFRRLGS